MRLLSSAGMLLLVPCAVMLLALLSSVSSVLAVVTLPPLGLNFGATIMHTYAELGYSSSYNEVYDGNWDNYRVDGKFAGIYSSYVTYGTPYFVRGVPTEINLRSFAYSWHQFNDVVCTKWPKHAGEDRSLIYGSTRNLHAFLSDKALFTWNHTTTFDTDNPMPHGDEAPARDIPCDVYTASYDGVFPVNVTLSSHDQWQGAVGDPNRIPPWSLFLQTIDPSGAVDVLSFHLEWTYYVSSAPIDPASGLSPTPVRLEVTGSYSTRSDPTTVVDTVDHTLDWTLWYEFSTDLFADATGGVFASPTQVAFGDFRAFTGDCDPDNNPDAIEADPYPLNFPPPGYVIPDPIEGGPPLPIFPASLYTVVEAKFSSALSDDATPRVQGIVWNLDLQTNETDDFGAAITPGRERVEWQSPTQDRVVVLSVPSDTAYGGGTRYYSSPIPGYPGYYTCSAEILATAPASPLDQSRAGGVSALYRSLGAYAANATYMGREDVRGVVCDRYQFAKSGVVNQGSSFDFTMDLHFAVAEWVFLNHPVSEGHRSLVRIVTTGVSTRLVSGVQREYEDTYDVFQYAEDAEEYPALFDPAYVDCVDVATPSPSTYPFTEPDLRSAQYAAVIERSDLVAGTTASWAEYVDWDRKLVRTDGKVGGPSASELVDFSPTSRKVVALDTLSDDDRSRSAEMPNAMGYGGAVGMSPRGTAHSSCATTTLPSSVVLTASGTVAVDVSALASDALWAPSLTYLSLFNTSGGNMIYAGSELFRSVVADKYALSPPLALAVDAGMLSVEQTVWVAPVVAGMTARVPLGTEVRGTFTPTAGGAVSVPFHFVLRYRRYLPGLPDGRLSGFRANVDPYTGRWDDDGVFSAVQGKGQACPAEDLQQGTQGYLSRRLGALNPTRVGAVVDPLTEALSLPAGQGFSMHFEARLSRRLNSSLEEDDFLEGSDGLEADDGTEVYSVHWHWDAQNGRERIDLAPQVTVSVDSADEYELKQIKSFAPVSWVWLYGAGSERNSRTGANVTAFLVQQSLGVIETASCQTVSGNATAPLPTVAINPLLTRATGLFFELFASASNASTAATLARLGFGALPSSVSSASSAFGGAQNAYRGIVGAVYTSSQSLSLPAYSEPGATYNVASQELVQAAGYWNWIGQAAGATNKVPLKYTQSGTYVPSNSSQTPRPYALSYDILSLDQRTPPPDLFDVESFGCAGVQPWMRVFVPRVPAVPSSSSSSSSSTGSANGDANGDGGNLSRDESSSGPSSSTVAIAVVVSIVGFVCIAAIIFVLCWRASALRKHRQARSRLETSDAPDRNSPEQSQLRKPSIVESAGGVPLSVMGGGGIDEQQVPPQEGHFRFRIGSDIPSRVGLTEDDRV